MKKFTNFILILLYLVKVGLNYLEIKALFIHRQRNINQPFVVSVDSLYDVL